MASDKRTLDYAKAVLTHEARAVQRLAPRLSKSFLAALDVVETARTVVCTGIGKPGFIAQKLAATLASVGVPSWYLHPAEAAHGDLGRVRRGDAVLLLSNSGASHEVLRLLPALKRAGAKTVALTAQAASPLGVQADVVVELGVIEEAGPMALVPTASSVALHALGDALAMTLAWRRGFDEAQYARTHPAGALGRAVQRVHEVMRSGEANPVIRDTATVGEALAVMTRTPGRPGAACVTDARGKLVGIFTDGDLRRLAERDALNLKGPLLRVMVKRPACVRPDDFVQTALSLLREKHVDQLPVVDAKGRAVGLLDVQDLL